MTVSAQCVEAVLEALVDAPAPAGQAPVAPAPPKVSGLGALAAALTLGQPHESIKAKASVAAALANCAALPEGRLALLSHGLLPVALGVLADATQPLTRAKALTQAGTDQPAVADRAEMSGLLVELCAQLCMLLRNAALSPACKGVLLEEEACLPLLAAILRSADSPALLAHAAGALQNLQDRSEARPGVPANPISAGERSMLKVHQLKQRLHAAGQGAAEPLPPSLRALDDDAEDGGPSSRTKRDFRLLPAQKLSATHDVKVGAARSAGGWLPRPRAADALRRHCAGPRALTRPRAHLLRAPRRIHLGDERALHLRAGHDHLYARDHGLQPQATARALRARAVAAALRPGLAAPVAQEGGVEPRKLEDDRSYILERLLDNGRRGSDPLPYA